ncbi:MAG: hypothetical protein VX464_20725 [Pseudomonadota bacterium]|nr:hypothetical protein [Pseudomonadota bacterium]
MPDNPHGADIYQMVPHDNLSVSEVLEFASRTSEDLTDVIVVGYDSEDGRVVIRSSRMTRAEALFLLEHAKLHAMGRLNQ